MTTISVSLARFLLLGQDEVAFLDVREEGQYGEGHALLATSVPYSVLEARVSALVPRRAVPVLLIDAGDGVATLAARRLAPLGHADVRIVEGGMPAWVAAGFSVFKGVNVPSKAFGELIEHAAHTPAIDATELAAMQARGEPLVVLDGRTPEEYRRMTIPGSVSCPNAELALRIDALAPDAAATVVVNCAGRTRSIIGAQSLIDLGVPHRVVALRNGTMGWRLADLELDHGAERSFPRQLDSAQAQAAMARARRMAEVDGTPMLDAATLDAWRRDPGRSLYVLDVRSAEEYAAGHPPDAVHAPGGQLVQATDQWVGVRNARIVLLDDMLARAVITAHWLRGMGHAVWVLEAEAAGRACATPAAVQQQPSAAPALARLTPQAVAADVRSGRLLCVDLRSSAAHRAGHPVAARWCIRPRLQRFDLPGEVLLLAPSASVAELAAVDLDETGVRVRGWLDASMAHWRAAGVEVATTPEQPADAERIDFLFFVHDRHSGNLAAAREYLAWETGLVAALDADERALFTVPERAT